MADGNRNVTWEEIMHLPEETRPEIIDGIAYPKLAVRRAHGVTSVRLGEALGPATRRGVRDGWMIGSDIDVALSATAFVRPDLAGWRLARLSAVPDAWPTTLLPDWVCEILSLSHVSYDRGKKLDAYARAGLPWIWLADPTEKTVEVLQLVAARWVRVGCYGPEDTLALPPFDETVVVVADLFPGVAGG